MVRSRWAVCWSLLLAQWASAGELSGSVQITADGRALRSSEAAEAVVYFRPAVPVPLRPASEPQTMATRRKQFVPHLLAIQAGESVRFPNEDPIFHNAFSTAAENAFDTGPYGRGEGKRVEFASAGLVRVYCNVHHAMFGFILVLDTPFHTRPDSAGRFVLKDLPDGPGELIVYHDRGVPLRRTVVVGETAELDLSLPLSRRKIPAHANKFGKPYGQPHDANY
ncbi:MAG: hypothetical protein AB7V26_04070 [Lysobacterales bacterium]